MRFYFFISSIIRILFQIKYKKETALIKINKQTVLETVFLFCIKTDLKSKKYRRENKI